MFTNEEEEKQEKNLIKICKMINNVFLINFTRFCTMNFQIFGRKTTGLGVTFVKN